MDFEALAEKLGEVNMGLFTGITMVMFAAIAAGAKKEGLMTFFAQHEQNFALRGQPLASEMMTAFRLIASSAQTR